MLKPAEDPTRPGGDRSIGELASQLVDDAKSYARAEVHLAKAIAAEKSKSVAVAAALFGAATLVAIGAVCAVSVAIVVALAYYMTPLLAGLATFLILGAVAAAIGWFGWVKLRDSL
ncbi:MAG TPA: phage holin family protein [Sphingomicrobium sp.]|nr:phage holin family protein [Sphingomicrobium sp.]